jgi:hypothetical protein
LLITHRRNLFSYLQDGDRSMTVFKYDARLDPAGAGGVLQYVTHPGQCQPTDSMFNIRTLACSTKLTQNASLLALLKWRQNPNAVQQTVRHIVYINGEEIVKFFTDIFDAVFAILDAYVSLFLLVFLTVAQAP